MCFSTKIASVEKNLFKKFEALGATYDIVKDEVIVPYHIKFSDYQEISILAIKYDIKITYDNTPKNPRAAWN